MNHSLESLRKRGQSLYKRLENLREKLSGTTAKAVRTLEVSAAAIAGGVIQGKAGPDGATIAHVPVDLGLGLALNVLGYFDAAGEEYSGHLNNFGDGFLASYLSNMGFHYGNKWREEGKLPLPFSKSNAALPGGTPAVAQGEISPDQMANIIARVREANAA